MATHGRTGLVYAVEAKSRHRPGLLGQPGTPPPPDEVEPDVVRLLRKALAKRAEHARIVFVDINMPPHLGGPFDARSFESLGRQLNGVEASQATAGALPAAFLFFTNHPYHYVGATEPEPGQSTYFTALNIPDFKQPNQDVVRQRYPAVFDLFDSVLKHTEIPHAFDNPGAP
jgi:hypothetical protein